MEQISEVDAIGQVAKALDAVEDDDARGRIIRWAVDRYKVAVGAPLKRTSGASSGGNGAGGSAGDADDPAGEGEDRAPRFTEFHDLFDATNPESDAERALVGSYWFQYCQSQADVDAMSVNTALKQLGHPIGNITRAFENLVNSSPRFAMQTRKGGSTKQARKRFKVTMEGKRQVERMIKGGNGDE